MGLANAIRDAGHDVVGTAADADGGAVAVAEARRYVIDGRDVIDRVTGTRTVAGSDEEVVASLRS